MPEEVIKKTTAVKALEATKESYELVKLVYKRAQEASRNKEPIAWCTAGVRQEILRAMGITPVWPEHFGAFCAAKQVIIPNLEMGEALGYPREVCSYARNCLGYVHKWQKTGAIPADAPAGGLPQPTMFLSNTAICDTRFKWFEAMATRYFDVPMYVEDFVFPSYDVNYQDEHIKRYYIDYFLEQTKGFIAFVEKHSGKKLDMDRLVQAVDYSQKAQKLWYQVHELRQAVPSPMASGDYFSCMSPRMYYLGTKEAVDFYQKLYNEVKYRVDNKIGIVSNEKYRLLWRGFPLWFATEIFNYFENLGAVCTIETIYWVGKPVEVDPSQPLEALALRNYLHGTRDQMSHVEESGIEGTGTARILSEFVRDFKIDGVIMNEVSSCRTAVFAYQCDADRLREQFGIPSLFIESDLADPRSFSWADTKRRIDAFMETLAVSQERRRWA